MGRLRGAEHVEGEFPAQPVPRARPPSRFAPAHHAPAPSSQRLHASASLGDEAAATPAALPAGINPLQQAPAPLSDRRAGGGGDPDGPDAALQARAVLRGVAISPRKLNMFAKVLRGLHVDDALIQCRLHPKKSARICEKVLLSARANAANNHGLDQAALRVEEAWVGRGTHLKRVNMHGKGKSGVLHKYRAHLTVVLAEAATRRRTRVVPMLAERQKLWDMRDGKAGDGKWWSWWPRKALPPHAAARRPTPRGAGAVEAAAEAGAAPAS